MIPRKDLEEAWYLGISRNNYIAYWDNKKQKFIYIRYKFQFYMDEIEHFEDVKDKGYDGFIPVQKIERLPFEEVKRIKKEVGY